MPNKQTYIKDVHLSGYKSIKNVNCDFEEGLNIIIGNNGSGKSNLLEFIYKVLERDYSGLDEFKAEINISDDLLKRLSKKEYFSWNVEGRFPKTNDSFKNLKVELIKEPDIIANVYVEFVRFNLAADIGILAKEFNAKYNHKEKRFHHPQDEENIPLILTIWLISFFNKTIQRDIDNINELTDSYLYSSLNESFNILFPNIRKNLLRYTPIEDLRFSNAVRTTRVDSSTLEFRNIVFEYKINNEWFAWSALSDGTRRLIYTIFITGEGTLNEGANPNYKFEPIALVDEPEIGIHPHQLHSLLDFFKDQSKEQQIIITTHSPQVLDIIGAEELNKIIIAEIDYENGTVLRHLNSDEMQKAQSYLKDEGLLSDYWRFSDLQRSKKAK
ncbi:MAG: AAA family ATPase [Bacteroidota bacterium]